MVGILLIAHRRNGIRTSGVLLFFWIVLVLCSLPHYVSQIRKTVSNTDVRYANYLIITKIFAIRSLRHRIAAHRVQILSVHQQCNLFSLNRIDVDFRAVCRLDAIIFEIQNEKSKLETILSRCVFQFTEKCSTYVVSSGQNLPPYTSTSFVGALFSLWFDAYVLKFYRTSVQAKDLWNLKYQTTTDYLVPLFYKYWNTYVVANRRKL